MCGECFILNYLALVLTHDTAQLRYNIGRYRMTKEDLLILEDPFIP